MNRIRQTTLIALIASHGLLAQAYGQAPPSPATPPSSLSQPATTSAVPTQLDNDLAKLREQISALSAQVASTEAKLTATKEAWNWILIVVSVVAVVPQLLAFALTRPTERRARESHALLMRGEDSAQRRAEAVHDTLISSSQKTLTLVNDTLELAKAASERAAKTLQDKAKAALRELDRSANKLIEAANDEKAFVEDAYLRGSLDSLAQKLNAFEINRFILPEDLQLSPACLFLKGMESHLHQRFEDAIEAWEQVVHEPTVAPQLRALGWYWIGYESNNLGKFPEALRAFKEARELRTGARRLELDRILLETRLFDGLGKDASSLLKACDDLLNQLDAVPNTEEIKAVRARTLVTCGNVNLAAGYEDATHSKEGSAAKYYEDARILFARAQADDKWGAFGLAEAEFRLGSIERAIEIFRTRSRDDAVDVYTHREEPRTKVVAKTTELICCLCVPEWKEETNLVLGQLQEALGRVDEQLTVYSQLQKRNVTKKAFRRDLDELIHLYGATPAVPAAV